MAKWDNAYLPDLQAAAREHTNVAGNYMKAAVYIHRAPVACGYIGPAVGRSTAEASTKFAEMAQMRLGPQSQVSA